MLKTAPEDFVVTELQLSGEPVQLVMDGPALGPRPAAEQVRPAQAPAPVVDHVPPPPHSTWADYVAAAGVELREGSFEGVPTEFDVRAVARADAEWVASRDGGVVSVEPNRMFADAAHLVPAEQLRALRAYVVRGPAHPSAARGVALDVPDKEARTQLHRLLPAACKIVRTRTRHAGRNAPQGTPALGLIITLSQKSQQRRKRRREGKAAPHVVDFVLEKRDVDHRSAMKRVARALGVDDCDLATAGIKDRRAVTLQRVSGTVRVGPGRAAPGEVGPGLRMGSFRWAPRQVMMGESGGNRFEIIVRQLADFDEARARAVAERGFFNYYGEQRFGGRPDVVGERLLRGELERRDVEDPVFACHAFQSRVFNEMLSAAVAASAGGGDVPERLPIVGPGVDVPEDVLQRYPFIKNMPQKGTWRETVVVPRNFRWEWAPPALRLAFDLPPGAYATELIREVLGRAPELWSAAGAASGAASVAASGAAAGAAASGEVSGAEAEAAAGGAAEEPLLPAKRLRMR